MLGFYQPLPLQIAKALVEGYSATCAVIMTKIVADWYNTRVEYCISGFNFRPRRRCSLSIILIIISIRYLARLNEYAWNIKLCHCQHKNSKLTLRICRSWRYQQNSLSLRVCHIQIYPGWKLLSLSKLESLKITSNMDIYPSQAPTHLFFNQLIWKWR